MSGANVMHHQPKLVLGLAKMYRSSPPKAEVRGSNPLECAFLFDDLLIHKVFVSRTGEELSRWYTRKTLVSLAQRPHLLLQ